MTEKTLIIFKPDAFERKKVGATLNRFEQAGYKIVACKMVKLTEEVLNEHYSHLVDKPYYPPLKEFMLSAPVIIMILEGLGVVQRVRNLIGKTNSLEAAAGTVRGDWGTDTRQNILHASDSSESADIEIKRFFLEGEIF